MKRTGLIVLCVLVVVLAVFAGCSGKKDTAVSGLKQSLDNTDLIGLDKGKDLGFGPIGYDLDALVDRLGREEVKKLRIGVSAYSMVTEWMVIWADELRALAKEYGFQIVVLSADYDPQKMAEDLKSLQGQQVDGIIAFASNAAALALPMTEIYNAGVPIVCSVPAAPDARVSGSINVRQDGKGVRVADGVGADANGAERFVMLADVATDSPILNDRRRGFESRINEKYPNIKIVDLRRELTETGFVDVIKEGLLANDKIDTVVGTSAVSIVAAYNAVKQLNRKVAVYGVENNEMLVRLLAEGDTVKGLHVQFANQNAYITLFCLLRAIAGEQLPPVTWEPEAYAFFYATEKEAPQVLNFLYGGK